MAVAELISTTTIVLLGFTVVLVVVAWLITEALARTFHLKRPRIDYWIILWLTWDALIHFILVSILKWTMKFCSVFCARSAPNELYRRFYVEPHLTIF